MLAIRNPKKTIVFVIISFVILVSNVLFMTLPFFEPIKKDVALWSFVDITVVLPLFFYLLIVHKQYSPFTVIPFMITCFWIAYLIIPREYHFLEWIKNGIMGFEVLFVLLELFLLLVLLRKIPTFRRTYKENISRYPLFLPRAVQSLSETFTKPRMLYVWLTEFSVFYYITSIFRAKKEIAGKTFTFHHSSNYLGIFIMLVHAMLIEIIGVHFMLIQVNHILAWVVTGLDIYTLFYLVADYRAITLSPIVLKEEEMHVQKGIRRHFVVRYDNIAYAGKPITKQELQKKEKQAYSLVFASLEEEAPKLEIQLKRPIVSYSFYGIKKTMTKFYLTPDHLSAFTEALHGNLQNRLPKQEEI